MTFLLLSLVVAVSGCRSSEEAKAPAPAPQTETANGPEDSRAIVATVHYLPIEGGFYGIVGHDGRRYDPVNLPAEFKHDGLSVLCRVRVLRNRASFHMWGQLVEIVDIQRR
jgi:hypothetical protein